MNPDPAARPPVPRPDALGALPEIYRECAA
jgi:hypothetical protein